MLFRSVTPPDAEAVIRMVERFAGNVLAPNTDLTEVGEVMSGKIPAQIREVINRAKLEALRRTGSADSQITGQDLVEVARELLTETELFNRKSDDGEEKRAIKVAQTALSASAMTLGKMASN